jgi:phenylalanyl-tRNA synthetase beta chain
MKFTLSWLKDHLETRASLAEIAAALDRIGLEVEGVDDPAERLGAFVIARVVDARQHPNADKLRVCQVEIAPGKPPVEVVCGAPNARNGLVGVFAPLGSYIPGTGLKLERKPVRGVVSNGMLCSERELEISDDHEGIIDLPGALAARVGERYVDVMGLHDAMLHIKVTPNRPDALGVRGIARDLAAAGLGKLKPDWATGEWPFPQEKRAKGKASAKLAGSFEHPVEIRLDFPKEAADACPCFASRYVRGVANGPSPAWLQQRLKAIGLRPINALVDITNYVTFDRGRPLHVYDGKKLNGAIGARLAKPGEKFHALDNKDYVAQDGMCMIADDSGPLGFGGVIGGTSTGCSEATTDVLIESAYFDPVRTANTGRRAGINSDARYRFERGIDPQSCEPGADLCARMILELCGGEASKLRVAGRMPAPRLAIPFDTRRVEKLAGLAVAPAEARRILEQLGFVIEGGKSMDDETFTAIAPTWRPDVHGAADLVEEIVRIVGIDKVPAAAMSRPTGVAHAVLTEGQALVRRARRALAARGFVEAITWSFITREQAAQFGGGQDALELDNPISSEMTSMRPSLLPGLLTAVQRNRDRGTPDMALFEVGQAYRGDELEDQHFVAAGVRAGLARLAGSGRHWEARSETAGVLDVKSDAFALLALLGLDPGKAQITRDAPSWYHPGRSGTLRLGPKTVLAHFGEMHPDALAKLDVDGPSAAFEVFLSALPASKKRATRAKLPLEALDLQPVRRDFAFVLDRKVGAGEVVRAAESVDKKLVAGVTVFDVFEGGKLAEEGKRSIAIEVTLQPREKTLTDQEIEAIAERIVASVKKATGGEIRG